MLNWVFVLYFYSCSQCIRTSDATLNLCVLRCDYILNYTWIYIPVTKFSCKQHNIFNWEKPQSLRPSTDKSFTGLCNIQLGFCICLPVLVGGAGCVTSSPHHWEGQIEVLQVKGEWLPGCPVYLVATPPLTLYLHGDWTLTGRQDPQSITLTQVC